MLTGLVWCEPKILITQNLLIFSSVDQSRFIQGRKQRSISHDIIWNRNRCSNIFRTGFMNSVEMFKLVAEGNRTHKSFRNDYKLILCSINDFQTFIFTGATNCILCVRDGKIFEKVFHRMKFSFSTLISSSFWCNKNWKNLESKWPNHNLSRWRAYCKYYV